MGIPKYRPIKFIVSRPYRFSKVRIGTRQKNNWLVSNGVFPKWSRTFTEFSEFRESDKSLKHELGSI